MFLIKSLIIQPGLTCHLQKSAGATFLSTKIMGLRPSPSWPPLLVIMIQSHLEDHTLMT